jgi:hypothetical protein
MLSGRTRTVLPALNEISAAETGSVCTTSPTCRRSDSAASFQISCSLGFTRTAPTTAVIRATCSPGSGMCWRTNKYQYATIEPRAIPQPMMLSGSLQKGFRVLRGKISVAVNRSVFDRSGSSSPIFPRALAT